MENDSIRASGTDTLVDIWIEGKIRAICITQDAIGAYLDFESVAQMSDDERCTFVKNNLSLVLSAAKARLREHPTANSIVIDAGGLPRADGKATNRRKGERRKSDRRKSSAPLAGQPERRRIPRRRGERRTRPPKSEK